jgi:hypothetical protein
MVKAYARSSAGDRVELVSEIRSPATCLKSLDYMFQLLDNDDFDFLHSWIWDRTRAVRKDLRTQIIEKRADIQTLLTCLERSARFYLLSMHQMARSGKADYSHQQDMEQFNQTLTSLRERYADNRRVGIPSENEAEFWSYRLILASLFANTQLEHELHGLPSDLRHNKRVLTAIEIFKTAKSAFTFASSRGWVQAHANWKKFWVLTKSSSVSYLMACAAEVGFNRMRHVVLDAIWHAYRKGKAGEVEVDAWTPAKLREVLAMDTEKEAVELCELHGFVFGRSAHGHTFLDISKLGNSNASIKVPDNVSPQIFSQQIVEVKRYKRSLSAVIHGMTVQQAKSAGLLTDATGEDSLFVPEAAKPNIFSQNKPTPATSNGTPGFSPFAAPFQPASQPQNPFTKALSQEQLAQAVPPNNTLFDASKNKIQFGSSDASNPFAKFSAPPTSDNAFMAANGPTQPNTPAPSFSSGGDTKPNSFTFPGSTQSQDPPLTFTPVGSPPPAPQDEEKQKAEAEARQAVLKQQEERRRAQEEQRRAEEEQKRAQEEKQRAEEQQRAREEEAQRAREAEQRRIQEEQRRIQEQQRLQQEQERRAREEHERLIQAERQRQQQEEQARTARIQRRESAYNTLTANVMFNIEEGLMFQFLENMAGLVAEDVMKELEREKKEKQEAEMRERKRLAFARAVCIHWIAQVQKKKRARHARERRRRLKAQRGRSTDAGDDTADDRSITTESVTTVAQLDGDSEFRKPRTVTGTRSDRRRTNQESGRRVVEPPAVQPPVVPPTNGIEKGYSETYYKSTAPIDRTETDWFKLRAMGIDPSKHRKRSFGSSSEEETREEVETKRLRRTDSTTSSVSQPPVAAPTTAPAPAPATLDERLARFRASRQSFGASGRTSVNGATPVNGTSSVRSTANGRSSLNGKSSLLIAQARDLIGKSPSKQSPFKQSLSRVQHDFGRSVPNLGMSTSSFGRSAFGKSAGADPNRPAYWGRASRFVPQHLYGKGPDAIRAYRDQYINSPSNTPSGTPRPINTEPLSLSSPIPTQLSYIPQPISLQHQYSDDEDAESADGEDEEGGSSDEDDFDDEHDLRYPEEDEEDEEEDEDEEEYSDDEDQSPFAQPGSQIGPGQTQDDAIELSD